MFSVLMCKLVNFDEVELCASVEVGLVLAESDLVWVGLEGL